MLRNDDRISRPARERSRPPDGRYRTGAVALTVGVWLIVAVAVGATGVIQSLRPPAPQAIVLGLTLVAALLGVTLPGLRSWVMTVDERLLVGFHLTRFVGVYFLVLYGRGQLPYDFAVLGGWGDIIVATTALGLIVLSRATSRRGWWAYSIWNVIGLVDIVFVAATAARLGVTAPESLRALLRLPLSLLLTWLVPLIIASHALLGLRLAKSRPSR